MKQGQVNFYLHNISKLVFLLLAVSVISFALVTASPIDPVDAFLESATVTEEQHAKIAAYWGLDKSPVERYLTWGGHLLQGDLGESITYHQPVKDVLSECFKASIALMGTAWIMSGLIGLALGILAGVKKDSWTDKIIKTICLGLASTPVFWVGLLVLVVFAIELQWFPIGLAAPIGKLAKDVTIWERLHHLALPAFTLSITHVASIALHTRQKLIDVLESDYVLFAKARGETMQQIIMRHGLRNIALPAITLQCASVSELFGGSVLAEKVFSYPGLGNAATVAGLHGDAPLLLGIALFSALFVFAGNLAANIIYGIVDPQIREGGTYGE